MSKRWNSDSFLVDISYDRDKFKYTHAQDIDPYLKVANEQRKSGQNNSDNMRKIASIPSLLFTKMIKEDPELIERPEKLIPKLKELKEKGLDFTTVERI